MELHVLGNHLRTAFDLQPYLKNIGYQINLEAKVCACIMSITPAESMAAKAWQTANLIPFATSTCSATNRDGYRLRTHLPEVEYDVEWHLKNKLKEK